MLKIIDVDLYDPEIFLVYRAWQGLRRFSAFKEKYKNIDFQTFYDNRKEDVLAAFLKPISEEWERKNFK